MVKIKYLLLTLYCIFFLFNCQQENERKTNHDLLIEIISREDPQYSSPRFSGLMVFCNIKDEENLGFINVHRLQILFNHDSLFQKIGYHKYVKDLIYRKISLDKDEIIGSFILNETTMSNYEKYSFTKFLSTYCDYIRKNEYSIKPGLSYEETMTIIYCLYEKNYYTFFDDYIGRYYSTKIDSILDRTVEEIEIELI